MPDLEDIDTPEVVALRKAIRAALLAGDDYRSLKNVLATEDELLLRAREGTLPDRGNEQLEILELFGTIDFDDRGEWTSVMPTEPGWYWTCIKGEGWRRSSEPQVCWLVDGVLWTADRELGMAREYVKNHCLVWSEAIRPPVTAP
jgi:hypothetical protein